MCLSNNEPNVGLWEVRTGKAGHACIYIEGTTFNVAVGMTERDAVLAVRAVNAYGYLKGLLIDRGFSDARLESLITAFNRK